MLFNLKIYLLGDVLMFQAIENDACGEHFFLYTTFVCLFVAYWVQKKRFNLIHSKL